MSLCPPSDDPPKVTTGHAQRLGEALDDQRGDRHVRSTDEQPRSLGCRPIIGEGGGGGGLKSARSFVRLPFWIMQEFFFFFFFPQDEQCRNIGVWLY